MMPNSHIGSEPGKDVLLHADTGMRERLILALLILAAASVTALILYLNDHRSFLYFGDGVSHLVRARHFIDSRRPGIDNLGTVWLPLPHLLLLPFAMIDGLFFTGIAAPIVGIPLLAGTALLLHAILRELTGSRSISFLGACLYALNPNIIYMALAPMSEPSFFFFTALAGYALTRWLREEKGGWPILCAASVALASLCRYEAWPLAPLVSLLALRRGYPGRKVRSRGGLLPAALLAWGGIALWLGWNYLEYGDAWMFARWTWSTISPVRDAAPRDPWSDLALFGKALLSLFGPFLPIAALGAIARFRPLRGSKAEAQLLLFFSLPALFALAAILAGFVRIDRWLWNWRYLLAFGPFLAAAAGIGLAEFFDRVRSSVAHGGAIACLLAVPLLQIAWPEAGIVVYEDASRGFFSAPQYAFAIGGRLGAVYREGSIGLLTGYGQSQGIMISARIPLKNYDLIYNPDERKFVGPDSLGDRYLVIGKSRTPESREAVDYWLSRRAELEREYRALFEDAHYLLLERIYPK